MNANELYGASFPRKINDTEPWGLVVTQYNDAYAECYKLGSMIGCIRRRSIYWVFKAKHTRIMGRVPRSRTLAGLYANIVAYCDEHDSNICDDHYFAALEAPMLPEDISVCADYKELFASAMGLNALCTPTSKFKSGECYTSL